MIVGVAALLNGKVYSLPKPARHHNLRSVVPGGYIPYDQGFIDHRGCYLDRFEAAAHAIDCKQITRLNWPHMGLDSKDVW